MLKNEALDAKIGLDTAENEPWKGSKNGYSLMTPLVICDPRALARDLHDRRLGKRNAK